MMRPTKRFGTETVSPWNFGDRLSPIMTARCRWALAALCAALLLSGVSAAKARQANQPGFDPGQPEKQFDNLQSGQTQPPARSTLRVPALARPDISGDSRPQFELRAVALRGASAIPVDQLATAYRPYLGKSVSQADLAAVAAAITDV
jgi:hemolysin activation/secretion protein